MNSKKILDFIHKTWKKWRLTIFLIVFVVIPIKSTLADWNWVPSASMNPTILEGDLIYVNKAAYGLRFPLTLHRLAQWASPQRGDIIICLSPQDRTRLVKRVIGLPGDTIALRNNVLLINGSPLKYSRIESQYLDYLPEKLKSRSNFAMEDLQQTDHAVMAVPVPAAPLNFGPVKVPDRSYFVMGDNRDNSRDSRYFGFVERDSIVGEAKAVIGSFDITDKYQPRLKRFFAALK